jgi:hypothetical protein
MAIRYASQEQLSQISIYTLLFSDNMGLPNAGGD